MGRRVILFVLLLIFVVTLLLSVPAVRQELANLINRFTQEKDKEVDEKDERPNDKACTTCHKDIAEEFKLKFGHKPFLNYYCTDCHTPHNGEKRQGKQYVVDMDKLCVTCHFGRQSFMPNQHTPYKNGLCVDCHSPHASDYEHLVRLPQKNLCTTCHRTKTAADLTVKHQPFALGNCGDCHDPHASMFEGMTLLPGKQLCYTCHFDTQKAGQLPVQHKPYKDGDCTDCHGPHATANTKLLNEPGGKLCLTCHKKQVEEGKSGSQHRPFATGNCADCHKPHASQKPALLDFAGDDLCYHCHTNMKDLTKSTSFHPLGTSLTCSNCHNPHSGPGDSLLIAKGNDLCQYCHTDLTKHYKQYKHNEAYGQKGKGLCINCHSAHKSNNKSLLVQEQIKMCLDCHEDSFLGQYNHPYGPNYKDSWNGGTIICTSCHGPHGTGNEFMFRKPKDGLCLSCHPEKMEKLTLRKD